MPPHVSSAAANSASTAGTRPAAAQARLEAMFRQHHGLIWRTLRRLGCPPDAAADYTQQAYLIAAERLDQIRPGCERAFLFSTAIRLSRTNHRRHQRLELVDDMDVHQNPLPAAERASSRHRAQQLLERILNRLDPDLVSVFVLFELEGLSTREIAELHDIPLGTAASRLRRAREAFRALALRTERSTKGLGT